MAASLFGIACAVAAAAFPVAALNLDEWANRQARRRRDRRGY